MIKAGLNEHIFMEELLQKRGRSRKGAFSKKVLLTIKRALKSDFYKGKKREKQFFQKCPWSPMSRGELLSQVNGCTDRFLLDKSSVKNIVPLVLVTVCSLMLSSCSREQHLIQSEGCGCVPVQEKQVIEHSQ